jgi:hypothetical protein
MVIATRLNVSAKDPDFNGLPTTRYASRPMVNKRVLAGSRHPCRFMDQYSTTCLNCGAKDRLEVICGGFMVNGMPLCPDGFSFSDAKGVDTEDEAVRCQACGNIRPLSDYTIAEIN